MVQAGSKPSSPGKEKELLPGQIDVETEPESDKVLPPGQLPPLKGPAARMPTPEPHP